ncbi:S-layer homology domain-containing protein [Paenibacillus sp. FJAT-26967]|uniref:S-layer homology domain-containing protein n=1 Tax=Paenibacillus sp. FJAT-26967 TaxID=1729690 RepID=UPI0009FC5D8A|nr:S-layer homology domain-containing protein [Paenibacillus sp. FJAT-26967]
MKSLHKVMSVLLAVCMLMLSTNAYAENILQNQAVNGGTINQNIVFIDVNNHWANDAIYDMAKKGIISGYEDSSFQPEKSITREEFAKLIALTFSLDLPKPGTPTFSDVFPDKWSYEYIEGTKEFLTGYYPPKGKAFFSPETKATREDVAVALVKTLGYSSNDVEDSNTLSRNFYDTDEISYALRDYVAIATEKQLISGYDDATFRPQQPITRAEVATLLFRVIKSSSQDQADGPMLEVSMPEKTENGTFYISGKTHRDAKVMINDESTAVVNGAFKEGFKLEEEGTYDVHIVAKLPSGKTNSVTKTITYKTSGPVLKLNDTPETVTTESFTISGTVKDVNDSSPAVYLNEEKLYVSSWDNSFTQKVTLKDGENVFTIKAKNKADKETVITKTVTLRAGGPVLKINSVADTTQSDTITVSGKVTDSNDSSPVVYLNDEELFVFSYDGSFTKKVKLSEGENILTFTAENKNDKVTTVVKKVTFNAGGPVLKINALAESTQLDSITVSGTVTDSNDSYPVVYLNGAELFVTSYSGSFSQKVYLEEGENTLTFKAQNKLGKTTTIVKSVTLNAGGPVIKLNSLPERAATKSITISGNVTDKNDSNPVVYLNEMKIYLYSGAFSEQVTLADGVNTFTIRVTNKAGKSSSAIQTITFEPDAPLITLNYFPVNTALNSVTITGTISDKNDNYPVVYFNDRKIYVYSGSFSEELSLKKGVNEFKVVASNKFGKTTTVTRNVYRNDK